MNYKNLDLRKIINSVLKEDMGDRDITTQSLIPADVMVKAVLLAKEDCVICGLNIAELVFKAMDPKIKFRPFSSDGAQVKKGKVIAEISGRARGILTAERVALNFLSFLSGISTKTKKYVFAVKPFKVKILDTRKTIPGLRLLEKYAVRTGGGYNHRITLDQMVMIKDNHLAISAGFYGATCISKVMKVIKKKKTKGLKIEVEVKNLKEFIEALKAGPDIIMLDNMGIREMKAAVKIKNSGPLTSKSRLKLEASGGITLGNVRKVAATGVDMISIGALTHSVDSVDISLEILE